MEDFAAPLREPPVRGIDLVDGAAVVRLAGELDLYNADEVRTALQQAIDGGARPVVVDLSAVEFVDSTTLAVFADARSRVGEAEFALAAPRLETRRALQVSGLDRHLRVHDTVEDALAG